MKKFMCLIMILTMVMTFVACSQEKKTEVPSEPIHVADPVEEPIVAFDASLFNTLPWPGFGIATYIPIPAGSPKGYIESNRDTYFSAVLQGVPYEYFKTYAESCWDAGFTNDYYDSSDNFRAYNEESYCVRVLYYENAHEMHIAISLDED